MYYYYCYCFVERNDIIYFERVEKHKHADMWTHRVNSEREVRRDRAYTKQIHTWPSVLIMGFMPYDISTFSVFSPLTIVKLLPKIFIKVI